jgi:hypothetical protein
LLHSAFELLDEYERANDEWVEDVRLKVDAAIEASITLNLLMEKCSSVK